MIIHHISQRGRVLYLCPHHQSSKVPMMSRGRLIQLILPLKHDFQALRALRRAKGLCIRYGAKWSRDHKCSEVVQLHLVQELLGMFFG
jgi:hypothetical protein